jgi:heavy metal sensor kinase
MNRHSIRFRLTAWYAVILAVTFAAVGIGVWLALRSSINDTVDKDLRSRLQAMRDYLQRQDSGAGEDPIEELKEDAALVPAGTRFRLCDGKGQWLYQSPGTQAWQTGPCDLTNLPKRGRVETIVADRKPIRVLSAAVPLGMVQIGIPLDEFREMLDAFTWTVLLASPILLLLASAGGYWMSHRALAPVERIARTAGEIEAQHLSKRLPIRGTGDELDHLSKMLNAMFARLEGSFRRITQFTADASHELRTPIAIIRTTAEVARRRPRTDREYVEALDRILAESERTTELLEDLMALARSDVESEAAAMEPVRLDQLVAETCAQAREMVQEAGLTLTVGEVAPTTIAGDYAGLRRLILILLDNAVKYSNKGGSISVGLRANVLEVRDTGIGISAEDLPHIFERFYRASKDRSRKIDGVGLGLSIASAIVQRHRGEIEISSELGAGSIVRIIFPAA